MDITHIVVYVLGLSFSLLILTLFVSYLIFRTRQNSNNHIANESNVPGTRTTLRANPINVYPVPGIENNNIAKADIHNPKSFLPYDNTNGNRNGNGHYKGNGQVRYRIVNSKVPYDQQYFLPRNENYFKQ